jgi:ribosomal protein S11
MSLRMCAGSLSELCAQYGMVNSACVVGSNGPGRAATQRDLHAENITDIQLRSR